MWAFMASWFTPSSLFVVVNLTIITIFLTSRFTSHRKPHQQEQHQQLLRAPSVLQRASSFNFSLFKFDQPNNPEPPVLSEYPTLQHSELEHVNPDPPTQIARTPSLLERLKSISVLYRSDSTTPEPETDTDESEDEIADPGHDHLVRRSKSDRVGGVVVKPGEKMTKSASEKSTLEKKRETASLGYDEEVDAKADDFINRFKQQLRLQRLNSLLSSRGK